MGCAELKSPILFFLVHRLRILKKQIWKSNNFAVGWITIAMIMMIDSDHLFDSTWSIAETHNLLTILYSLCIIFQISSLPSTSQKSAYFFAKDTLVLSIFLCDCCKMFICKLRKCTKHRYWSCSVPTLSLVRLLGGIFRVHQRNIYHSETISNALFIL